LLRKARTVHVAGFRSSYAIAFGFAYLYRLFRPSVSLVGTEGATLEMQLRAIAPGDVTVVISFAPYSREARLVAEAASRAKSQVIAITDSAMAPIARRADETVVFSVTSPSFFPSLVGGISVAESLWPSSFRRKARTSSNASKPPNGSCSSRAPTKRESNEQDHPSNPARHASLRNGGPRRDPLRSRRQGIYRRERRLPRCRAWAMGIRT